MSPSDGRSPLAERLLGLMADNIGKLLASMEQDDDAGVAAKGTQQMPQSPAGTLIKGLKSFEVKPACKFLLS